MDSARHLLNRLSYGALPDQVETVAREGGLKWVDRRDGGFIFRPEAHDRDAKRVQ